MSAKVPYWWHDCYSQYFIVSQTECLYALSPMVILCSSAASVYVICSSLLFTT